MNQILPVKMAQEWAASGSKWLLMAGILSIAAAHITFGIGLAAWVSSLPFLLFLAGTQGWKSRLLFAVALIGAWSLAIVKIITPPIPLGLVFLFSVPIALVHLPGYLLWVRFRTHPGGFLLFPVVLTLTEWLQYTCTPFASWGVAAYTQVDNPALMQSLSLFGMPGLSFLVYWVNVSLAEMILKRHTLAYTFPMPFMVLAALWVFGALRIANFESKGRDTIALAAVGTDSEISGLPLATPAENEIFKSALFARTRTAAHAGAKIVVWNEAALAILPEEEPALKDSLTKIATENGISLFAAYVVAITQTPLLYENKYLRINSHGQVLYRYQKHEPVPGEPAAKNRAPLEVAQVDDSEVGGAICYDYDFPYLARGFGELRADIAVIPSSDWRGIDPVHSKMAAFRAVEQGHSLLRSTRFGLSAGINPCGKMVAQMSSFDHNGKIMWANLPRKGVWTFYAWAGDWFVWFCFCFSGWFLFRRLKRPPKDT